MGPFRKPEEVMEEAAVGDLIEFERIRCYKHWAVFVGRKFIERGDGVMEHLPCLVHYSDGTVGDFNSKNSCNASHGKGAEAVIRVQPFMDVANGCLCRLNNALDSVVGTPFTGKEVQERAYSQVGRSGYSLWWNNCEHFVNWCRYDRKQSQQTRDAGWMLIYVDGLLIAAVGAFTLLRALRS